MMFETFLHDHSIYEEYMSEFKSHRKSKRGVFEFFKRAYVEYYIIDAFEWHKTKKGFEYWESIHNSWVFFIMGRS